MEIGAGIEVGEEGGFEKEFEVLAFDIFLELCQGNMPFAKHKSNLNL